MNCDRNFRVNLKKPYRHDLSHEPSLLFFKESLVTEFLLGEYTISAISCTEGFSIYVGSSGWRLVENNQYLIGSSDYYFSCLESQSTWLGEKLRRLVGKTIMRLNVDASGMDVKLEFEEGCILEIFTRARTDQWQISRKDEIIFRSNMNLLD